MNLGEKTDIKTGRSKTGANEEPLESYIPGVGRKNRSSSASGTGDYDQPSETHHQVAAPHRHEETEPLESYIPGVGRRNHPLDPEAAKEARMGHSTGSQNYDPSPPTKAGQATKDTMREYNTDPHIPGTGNISKAPEHMKKSHFDPSEMTANKMDSQHMSPHSQATAIPGVESRGANRIPGTQSSKPSHTSKDDTIDRGSVPMPAHVNDGANIGVNAPARKDSRKVSEFKEPSDLDRSARQDPSRQADPILDFPAHAYDTPKTNLGSKADASGHQIRGANVATAAPAAYESSHHHTAETKSFDKDSTMGQSSHAHGADKDLTHTEPSSHSGPKLFGKEFGFHKSHPQQEGESKHEEQTSHSGPRIFGKEVSFGKKHPEHEQRETHKASNSISPRGPADPMEHAYERNRTGSTTSTGDRRASTGSTGEKNKQYPSKVATVEDQPVKESPVDSGVKKTDRSLSIGSEEAGSYAKNVVNMPSLVDPSVPTYRRKEDITTTVGEGGSYKVHSQSITDRKVSVGSHEHEPQGPGAGSHAHSSSIGSHRGTAHADHGQVYQEPVTKQTFEKTEVYDYGPESVPRSHKQKDGTEEAKGQSHEEHTKTSVLDTIKNAITHHSSE